MNCIQRLFFKPKAPEDLAKKYKTIIGVCYWVWCGNIKYIRDIVKHKVKDYWQTPKETMDSRSGDCEDSGRLIHFAGTLLGYDCKMFVIHYRKKLKRKAHAVCVFEHKGRFYHASNWGWFKTKAKKMDQVAKYVVKNTYKAYEYHPEGKKKRIIPL